MRQKRTMEQRLHDIVSAEAKGVGPRHDFLTMEQWLETLAYFNYRCAYCGGPFQVIEHYLRSEGTTVSNCVPACFSCNVMKDKYGHDLSFYQNENVLRFIESKGSRSVFMCTSMKFSKDFIGSCAAKNVDENRSYLVT